MKCKNLPDEAVIGFTVLGFGRGNRESFELLGLWWYRNLSADLVEGFAFYAKFFLLFFLKQNQRIFRTREKNLLSEF
jgi:hypothetical protein